MFLFPIAIDINWLTIDTKWINDTNFIRLCNAMPAIMIVPVILELGKLSNNIRNGSRGALRVLIFINHGSVMDAES